jgi:hypothetical protein
MDEFQWKECAFLYTESGDPMTSICQYFATTFKSKSDVDNDINPVYVRKITDTSPTGFQTFLTTLKARSRIIISCLESQTGRRNYM